MTPPDNSDISNSVQWASRQLADYEARNPGTLFADGLVLNEEEGYVLQAAVAQLRCQRGERAIGYKVGCTSPTIRSQLGIDHCVSGRLYDAERHQSGAMLSRSAFANLAIEGELAVELSRAPTESDLARIADAEVPACVARVIPVIELHNHVLRGARPTAGELIAHNALHAGFVEGAGVRPEQAIGDPSLAIYVDDRLIETCTGTVLIKTIRSSLQWLIECLRGRGERLSAGQIILTGSIPSLIPIDQDCRILVKAPPFGTVAARFVGPDPSFQRIRL